MSIVYLLLNETNFTSGKNPFLYIGSKLNCEIVNGKIIDKNGKEYWSSSKYVIESIGHGDDWVLFDYIVVDSDLALRIEAFFQDEVDAAFNKHYYNKSHANAKFNSTDPETREKIRECKLGVKRPAMFEKGYYERMHTPEARRKNSESRIGNPKVINAAKRRYENQSKDPEWVKWRSELSSRTFKGRKLTEHEINLRKHDDRYKPNRKLTNEQVWDIRFSNDKLLSLNELCEKYPDVTKATLCRVRNFRVFKDITEDWKNEQ